MKGFVLSTLGKQTILKNQTLITAEYQSKIMTFRPNIMRYPNLLCFEEIWRMELRFIWKADSVLYFIIQEISCMSEEQQTIKWGDIIRIHGVSTIPGRECKGLIISKGFTDPNIYYQTYQEYKDVNFYRESLFQIMPKSNFDLHDQLLNDEKVKEQQRDALKERAQEQVTQLISNLVNKYQDKEHPEEVNVRYGAEVVFKHVESGEYLCGVYKAADIREGAFKLELAKDLSSQIIFKLLSHRSYEQQGNKIYYDDCLRIYHLKSDCYMNFPYDDDINKIAIILDREYEVASFEKEDKGYEISQNRPNIKKPVGRRINVINQNKPKCLWKFIQHCKYEDSLKKQKIKSHDIVYFQHTKQKGLIASTLAKQKYYLKEIKVCSQESVSYECFWQLIPTEGNEFGPEKGNKFWARNIVTGQILTYNDRQVEIQSKEDMKQGGGFKSEGLVNLVCGTEGEEPNITKILLERGEPFSNEQTVSPVVKYFDSNVNKIEFKTVTALTGDSFIIVRVSEQTILDVSYILSSQEAIVKIVEILTTELKKKKSDPDCTWKDMFMRLDQDLLQSFISVLKLLAGKIFETSFDTIQSSGNSPIRQIQKILVQTGISQLLIEIIFTLYEPFIQILSNDVISEDKARRLKVAEIFELSYILVQKIVKDFVDNKIYFSRWIQLFLEHSNQINKTFIQETLISILENNPVSIKAMIKAETIDNLIESFFKQAANSEGDMPTKHLRLFSTFIRGENVIFKENQRLILKNFFTSQRAEHTETINYLFKFKVEYRISEVEEVADDIISKERNKVVKIALGSLDLCTIPEFYYNYPNKFNYLLSYINLLADVCMDRNNQAIEYVQTNLPLAVVSSVLFDPEIAALNKVLKDENSKSQIKKFQISNIHEPFIRIGHHVYVNNFKFSPIQRIRKIVKWYKYQEGEVAEVEDITRTKRVYEGQKQEEEKTYLRYLLIYIKKFLETCDRQISNLEILYTVLNFLKETILLGLWDSINQFRQIIPLLIKNIIKIEANVFFLDYDETAKKRYGGKEWVDINKDKLKMNRPEIALAIQCKIKANQIFKYINEMENDIRIRYMMSFFQGIYEATENVENYSQPIEDQVNQQALTDLSKQQKDKIIQRNQKAKEEYYKIFGTNILGEVKKYSEDEDMLMKNYLWYNKIRTMIPLQYDQQIEEPDKDRDLFKYAQEDFPPPKIVLSLFQLSGYYNKNLLNSSLNMLRGMYEQRSDIIESYKNLLICGKGNLSEVYSNLKFMRNKFAMLKNDIIVSYDGIANKSFAYAIFKPYDHLGREEDKRSGIIQDLFFLARTLKDNVSLKNIQSLMHVEKEVFNKDIVYQFYNEREKNNYLFQQLNMAEGIYDPLIEYIKIIGNQNFPQIHRWLLFSIYQYLTLLCFNNMKAKHLFMKYIPDILPHLSKRVGAASFLYEVCINNKILVNNQEMVNLIFQKALTSCIQLQQEELVQGMFSNAIKQDFNRDNGFQISRIMHSLRGLLIFNDQGHKKNQQILLNKLSDNRFRKLVYSGPTRFTAKKEDFNLTPQITYITARFQLFSLLVESQNLINIGKLQNMHSYQYILSRLTETNRWQLRRALRSYLNRLYYVHQDKNNFMFEKFVAEEFKIINGELVELIELHRSKMLTEDLKVKNGIRFSYAQSEIILLILQILITLHEVLLKPRFIAILLRELRKQDKFDENRKLLHLSLIKLLSNLGRIDKLYRNTKTIVSFIKEIVELLRRNVFSEFPVRFLQKMSQPNNKLIKQSEDKSNDKEQKTQSKNVITFDRSKSFFRNLVDMIRFQKQAQKRNELVQEFQKNKNQMDANQSDLQNRYIQIIFSVPQETLRPINAIKIKEQQDEHYQQHLQTANSKMFKLLAKPQFEENQENLELNNRLNNVKELLSDSPVLKKLKQDQFYKLVGIFTNMDSISSEIYAQNWTTVSEDSRPVFSRREIITNCFSLIINYPDMIRDEQKIFIIKLVRCYIAEAVQEKQNHKLSVDKWNAEYYSDETSGQSPESENRSQLVKRQHQIQECGGSKLLLSIFKENLYTKPELLNEALLLGIVYLYNGNTYCQNSILNELIADRSNSAFVSLKNLIRNIGNFLIEVRKFKQNEKKRDFSFKIVDSYDHFDKKENILVKMFGHKADKFQIQTELNYELALCRAFRFLQLFCENNNIQMKKFVMNQTNDNGEQKITTINFILEASQLLRQFFKIMSIKIVNIPPSILDFINEITQIPCVGCQKSFMRSTFFEDMSYMAGFFQQKKNIQQRKFNYFLDSEKSPQEQAQDPLNVLQQIYEKGIGLALSNFQGNDDEIFSQFLNKSQPRYLWIVIRQNMIKLLRPRAHLYGVNRQQIENRLKQKYQNSKVKGEKEEYLQFRQFLVEKEFIRQIFDRFDARAVAKFIVEQRAKNKEFGQQICNIINVLIILKKIDDYADKKKKAATANPQAPNLAQNQKAIKAKRFREDMYSLAKQSGEYIHIKDCIQTFQDLILSIEVSSDNGEVISFQNVYFPRHPVFSYLAADTRDTIMFNVSRATRRDKLIQLQDYYPEIQQQIKWNYDLKYYKGSFLGIPYSLSITSQFIQEIRKAARSISYIICALMLWLIVVEHDTSIKQSYFIFFHYNEKLIMRAICLIQLILTLLFSALWIKMRLKLCLSKRQKQMQQEGGDSGEAEQAQQAPQGQQSQEAAKPVPTGLIEKVIFYAIFITNYFFQVVGSIKSVGKWLKKIFYDKMMSLFGFRHISLVFHFFLDPVFNFIKDFGIGCKALLDFEPGFLSILIFVLASIMGNFFGVEWYVIHLFDYFVGIPLLTNVFKAVINNISELTLLSTFAGCFILVFNIITLNTYTPVIYQDDIPAESCVDIIGCVLQVYTSGAIGDDMDQIYPGRFTFDTIYVIFMQIIFSNMISGIMIDSFGSLKEADAERDQDKKNICYICSMTKPDMQKQGTTFKKHTDKHFLWNYIFYRYVVQMKDPCDYTGLQYTISTQINELKIDWFPDNGPKDEGGAIEELMSQIRSKVQKMTVDLDSFIGTQTNEITSSKSSIQHQIEFKNKKAELEGGQHQAIQVQA